MKAHTTGPLPLRVCLWFAINPDRLLTTPEVAKLFEVKTPNHVSDYLARAVAGGWLCCTTDDGKKFYKGPNEYTAGPKILALHGRVS